MPAVLIWMTYTMRQSEYMMTLRILSKYSSDDSGPHGMSVNRHGLRDAQPKETRRGDPSFLRCIGPEVEVCFLGRYAGWREFL